MKKINMIRLIALVLFIPAGVINAQQHELTYPVVDTGQTTFYNNSGVISNPEKGQPFSGQDSQYQGLTPSYTDNGDNTITDNNTGLMWLKTPEGKMTWAQAMKKVTTFEHAGYSDWRMPTIKELYSLINFNGVTGRSAASSLPFINTYYFKFSYGNTGAGERFIDSQFCSATKYVSTTMNNNATIFGVNFADGRIKGYPQYNKTYYALYVRSNPDYGINKYVDNGDGTVTDEATGLMWMQADSGSGMNWQKALAYAENFEYGGYSDWRLPNVKELQSIVDYSRSPDTTQSAAIDPLFTTTPITDGNGDVDYPFYWTSTTHLGGGTPGSVAAYVAFGEAEGYMKAKSSWGGYQLQDVHGAGAQRSDPKSGDPAAFPNGRGPQGDVIYIYNYVRLVRGGTAEYNSSGVGIALPTPQGNHFISRLDKNGDNKVSASEFDGPTKHFYTFDCNNDGFISADEAPTGPPPKLRR